jgi:hypothetical protein
MAVGRPSASWFPDSLFPGELLRLGFLLKPDLVDRQMVAWQGANSWEFVEFN